MNADPACPHSLPGPDASPMPGICGPEGSYSSLHSSSAEMLRAVSASPLPSSSDLPLHDSPDSSTSPTLKVSDVGLEEGTGTEEGTGMEENQAQGRKQKMRTVFSQSQLYVLNDRFRKQKYLNLQQMQELSSILNLSYKQVKTWFQNQRMKHKRLHKTDLSETTSSSFATQSALASADYSGLQCSYPQGYLVNTSTSLPMWSSQTWSSPAWGGQTWNSPAWGGHHSWNTQVWNAQPWSAPFHNFGEESLQPYMQFPQNFSASDLETSWEMAGESHKYFSTPQALDFFLNSSANPPPDDV